MTRDEVRIKLNLARKIHLDWARFQEKARRDNKPQVPHVGTSYWHRKWVKIYDEALRLIV